MHWSLKVQRNVCRFQCQTRKRRTFIVIVSSWFEKLPNFWPCLGFIGVNNKLSLPSWYHVLRCHCSCNVDMCVLAKSDSFHLKCCTQILQCIGVVRHQRQATAATSTASVVAAYIKHCCNSFRAHTSSMSKRPSVRPADQPSIVNVLEYERIRTAAYGIRFVVCVHCVHSRILKYLDEWNKKWKSNDDATDTNTNAHFQENDRKKNKTPSFTTRLCNGEIRWCTAFHVRQRVYVCWCCPYVCVCVFVHCIGACGWLEMFWCIEQFLFLCLCTEVLVLYICMALYIYIYRMRAS